MLSFVSMLGNVKLFLLSICAAVMFTILLVSGNTMAMSVRERVREVGVLKTLGFTGGNILLIILGEAVRHFGGRRRHRLPALHVSDGRRAQEPGRRVSAAHQAIRSAVWPRRASLVALVIGLVSSFMPAWNASRTTIVEALRSTD